MKPTPWISLNPNTCYVIYLEYNNQSTVFFPTISPFPGKVGGGKWWLLGVWTKFMKPEPQKTSTSYALSQTHNALNHHIILSHFQQNEFSKASFFSFSDSEFWNGSWWQGQPSGWMVLSKVFGGNDDYPPTPTTTTIANDNNISILMFKTVVPLICFNAYTITISLFLLPNLYPILDLLPLPFPWHIRVLGLHLSASFLDF